MCNIYDQLQPIGSLTYIDNNMNTNEVPVNLLFQLASQAILDAHFSIHPIIPYKTKAYRHNIPSTKMYEKFDYFYLRSQSLLASSLLLHKWFLPINQGPFSTIIDT